MAQPQPTGTIIELQSLRGLAALAVVVHHCGFYYGYDAALWRVFEICINAHAAVVLFYVLSGFVLYLALRRSPLSARAIATFYLRRAGRIYPALWLAATLALAYVVVFGGRPFAPTVSSWFEPAYRTAHLSPIKTLAAYLGLSHALPLPMWSITIELAASLLMPVIVFSAGRKALCVLAWARGCWRSAFWRHAHADVCRRLPHRFPVGGGGGPLVAGAHAGQRDGALCRARLRGGGSGPEFRAPDWRMELCRSLSRPFGGFAGSAVCDGFGGGSRPGAKDCPCCVGLRWWGWAMFRTASICCICQFWRLSRGLAVNGWGSPA
jgi:peptidoglycan/LPS O-acetylase OafA/YrhL